MCSKEKKNNVTKTKKEHWITLTLIELSDDELNNTGSFTKKCSESTEPSCASFITDWSLLFSRFHMLMTPEEPPDARRGCPSKKEEYIV